MRTTRSPLFNRVTARAARQGGAISRDDDALAGATAGFMTSEKASRLLMATHTAMAAIGMGLDYQQPKNNFTESG